MDTCSGGILTEGFYDAGCETLLFADQFGGDYMCKDEDSDDSYTYYEIDCNGQIIKATGILSFYIQYFNVHSLK